jgi:hypothetical protein
VRQQPCVLEFFFFVCLFCFPNSFFIYFLCVFCWLSVSSRRSQRAKLRSVLHYFQRLNERPPEGHVTFARQVRETIPSHTHTHTHTTSKRKEKNHPNYFYLSLKTEFFSLPQRCIILFIHDDLANMVSITLFFHIYRRYIALYLSERV